MSDLTRWNRSGLRRFRYVNGNAVEFLEKLRREFVERLPDWNPLDDPPPPIADPDGEEPQRAREREIWAERREERLQKLYARKTGDLGWEIARTFVRACHVLAEHVDAFANEGFLETATQWESVRRLVSLLDYHPAPPASATTYLALKAKPDSAGRIEAGFAVESVGESAGSPVVFETLEDIDLDSTLDELKPAGADVSPKTFDEAGNVPWLGPRKQNVRTDQPVLINCVDQVTGDTSTAAATIKNVSIENGQQRIELVSGAARLGSCVLGTSELSVSPSWDRAPRLNGPDVWFGSFDPDGQRNPVQPHGLKAGDVVAWETNAVWVFADVTQADTWGVVFSKAPPAGVTDIYQAVAVKATDDAGNNVEVLLPNIKAIETSPGSGVGSSGANTFVKKLSLSPDTDANSPSSLNLPWAALVGLFPNPIGISTPIPLPLPWEPALIVELAKLVLQALRDGDTGDPSDLPDIWPPIEIDGDEYRLFDKGNMTLPSETNTFLLPPSEISRLPEGELGPSFYLVPELGQPPIIIEQPDSYVFDGDPGPLGAGEPCVGNMAGDGYIALTIKKVKLPDGTAYVPGQSLAIPVDHFYVTFEEQRHPQELEHLYAAFRGSFLPEGHDQNDNDVNWEECLPIAGDVDVPDGRLLLLSDGANSYPVTATPCGEDGIRVTPPPPDEIAIKDLKIYGNVVLAGHGERRSDRQLSGGPGGSIVRELLFEVSDVSFVSDSSQPGGVRADIEVTIDGEIWEQVGSLRTSSPTDPHYTVRITEERQLMLGFGDGAYGRRLPSGTNNINVRYRVGVGVAGNVAAGNLVRALERHPLVEEIFQFDAATGGNDAESVDDVRENGPQSVLTLDRAVSLDDFTHLAASHSSVWHARAFYTPAGDRLTDRIEVVVVPAGGGPLGDLKSELEEFLTVRAVPGVFVCVEEFFPVHVSIAVELRVDVERYEQKQVRTDVELALQNALSLEKRGIGQALSISEVYGIVENVVGVANSHCRFRDQTFATTMVSPDDEFVGARRTDVIYLDPAIAPLVISSERLTL